MKVAVTGAAGFLGAEIARDLARMGIRVTGMVRRQGDADVFSGIRNVSVVVGEVEERASLAESFGGCDAVIHCAARMKSGGSAAEAYKINVGGTGQVLKMCRQSGVERLVQISTLGVYDLTDAAEGAIIDENWPTARCPERRGVYSRTKLAAELLLKRSGSGREGPRVVILRAGALYGAGRAPTPGRLGKWVNSRIGVAVGHAGTFLDITHVRNVAAAVRLALNQELPNGTGLNIVDSDHLTQEDYCVFLRRDRPSRRVVLIHPSLVTAIWKAMWSLIPKRARMRSLFDPIRILHATRSVRYSTLAAREMLGWSPFGSSEACVLAWRWGTELTH